MQGAFGITILPDKIEGVDLIIACGDLNRHYLEYLTTMAPVPVLYVHGNHDENYDHHPPEGAICLDDDLFVYHGLRIVGLGGSCRYRTGAWQFTEAEMRKRSTACGARSTATAGLTSLVTHAPMHGYGDLNDLPHRGFTVFHELLDRYSSPADAAWSYPSDLRLQHPTGAPVWGHPHRQLLRACRPGGRACAERTHGAPLPGTPAAATLTPFVRRTTHD